MDVLQNKIQNRVSSVQKQTAENIDTENEYFEKEFDELKELDSAKVINFIKKRKIFVISFLLIAAIGYGVYGKYFDLTDAERAEKELAAAVAAVSKLMIIPEGDEPVLATVTDAEALTKQQAFFTGAVNGDQLLLFPRNLKAVIYSPSRNKIINAGPIEQQPRLETTGSHPERSSASNGTGANPVSNGASDLPADLSVRGTQAEATVGRQNTLTVEVRNGTGKSGLAARITESIRAAGYSVIAVADATKKNYAKTIVFSRVADDNKQQTATALASMLNAVAAEELPKGEKSTEADVLVILGGE